MIHTLAFNSLVYLTILSCYFGLFACMSLPSSLHFVVNLIFFTQVHANVVYDFVCQSNSAHEASIFIASTSKFRFTKPIKNTKTSLLTLREAWNYTVKPRHQAYKDDFLGIFSKGMYTECHYHMINKINTNVLT